jgi:hypothetical protein
VQPLYIVQEWDRLFSVHNYLEGVALPRTHENVVQQARIL